MKVSEYAGYDALGLAGLIKAGSVSAGEVAEAALAAIDALNPQLNAIIEVYRDANDRRRGAASQDGVFSGVPFFLKDIGSHDADVTFELGSRLTRGLKSPPFASELVNRFRATGVQIMGRTNIPELGSSCTTEPLLYGPTRNPWNLDRTPGGSSGGAAAAVASGMAPIAHANDAGGSIRFPASCCGLFGLKPSRNLNPTGPDAALQVNGVAAELIVSRTVRDTAAMLDATAGPDLGAWCYTPRLNGSYLRESQAPPKRLRIALNLHANFPPAQIDPVVAAATRATAKLCEDLGHDVEEASLDFDAEFVLKEFSLIWSTGLRCALEQLSALTGRAIGPDTVEPHLFAAYRDSEKVTASQLHAALEIMNTVARAYGALFSRYDVMLTPMSAAPPFKLGTIGAIPADNFYDWFLGMSSHSPFTSSVNIAGVPAMSVPLNWSDDRLPMGSHFVAGMGQELLLLQLAAQLEQAAPWKDKIAPIHASRL